jgi:hypothetical protein
MEVIRTSTSLRKSGPQFPHRPRSRLPFQGSKPVPDIVGFNKGWHFLVLNTNRYHETIYQAVARALLIFDLPDAESRGYAVSTYMTLTTYHLRLDTWTLNLHPVAKKQLGDESSFQAVSRRMKHRELGHCANEGVAITSLTDQKVPM